MAGNDQDGLGALHSYLAEVAAFPEEEGRSLEGLRRAESARDEGLGRGWTAETAGPDEKWLNSRR